MKVITTKKTVTHEKIVKRYASDDGKEIFDKESDCFRYENNKLIESEMERGNIIFLDSHNQPIPSKTLEVCTSCFLDGYVFIRNAKAAEALTRYESQCFFDCDKDEMNMLFRTKYIEWVGARATKVYSDKEYQRKIQELNEGKALAEKWIEKY